MTDTGMCAPDLPQKFKIISLHNKFKVNLGYETCLKNQN